MIIYHTMYINYHGPETDYFNLTLKQIKEYLANSLGGPQYLSWLESDTDHCTTDIVSQMIATWKHIPKGIFYCKILTKTWPQLTDLIDNELAVKKLHRLYNNTVTKEYQRTSKEFYVWLLNYYNENPGWELQARVHLDDFMTTMGSEVCLAWDIDFQALLKSYMENKPNASTRQATDRPA